jgi:hypothetical protein
MDDPSIIAFDPQDVPLIVRMLQEAADETTWSQ